MTEQAGVLMVALDERKLHWLERGPRENPTEPLLTSQLVNYRELLLDKSRLWPHSL